MLILEIGISALGHGNQPYGLTLPGRPAVRYSNGRVFSDYIGPPSDLLFLLSYILQISVI